MRIRTWLLTLVISKGVLNSGLQAQDPIFGERVDLGLVEYGQINEASGLAASRKNAEVLWTHNDSDDKSRIFALNTQGKHLGVYAIAGVTLRDWEDLAIGPGPAEGQDYLYIGEIGDNAAAFDLKYIYRIPEPGVNAKQEPVNVTLSGAETITLQYPDGNRDAETLVVDPLTKDVYIISKRESNVGVYRAPYPQSTTQIITLEKVATLPFSLVVAGDISPSGNEILVKTYDAIYYWHRASDQNLWQAFDKAPIKLPYIIEPQGEAVGWKPDGKGYYTVSEEFAGIPAHLYFYPRQSPVRVGMNGEIPPVYALYQNYPNPFNPNTTIGFSLPIFTEVDLKVFDALGQEVATLAQGLFGPGKHEIQWQAISLASGVYWYRWQAGNVLKTKALILSK